MAKRNVNNVLAAGGAAAGSQTTTTSSKPVTVKTFETAIKPYSYNQSAPPRAKRR